MRQYWRLLRAVLGVVTFAILWPMACTNSGLVGGECYFGLTPCGGDCVHIGEDLNNCGACGRVCDDDVQCIAGSCTTTIGQPINARKAA